MHLHDGKPCPVCGSSEHPNKADSQGTVPSKEELEGVKKDLDEVNNQYRDAIARLKSNGELLETKAKEVTDKGFQVEDAPAAVQSYC